MTPQAPTDHDLLTRIATGDRGAMDMFFQRHHDALYSFVRGRGADADRAGDVVQEAMLEVWRTANRYGGAASARTWLFAIARNKFVDLTRKAGRVQLTDTIPEQVDTSPDAAALLEAASDADRVRACLSKLKPEHQTAIRLAYYEELGYDEIAGIEDVPTGTIKTRIYHAKKLLMRCLGRR